MPGDRMYRGRCEHAAFWMLLDPPTSSTLIEHPISCPLGCVVVLDTLEPPPAASNGRS